MPESVPLYTIYRNSFVYDLLSFDSSTKEMCYAYLLLVLFSVKKKLAWFQPYITCIAIYKYRWIFLNLGMELLPFVLSE